ncbi:MAG: helix-turn-helix domain-containing protein, partial [Planctomycetota bacterium]
EEILIRNTLEREKHNRERTAKALGISERTLYRKIKDYGL